MRRIPPFLDQPKTPRDGAAWLDHAGCLGLDTEAFFAAADRAARSVCRGCAVSGECLDYAISEKLAYGVWGSLSGDDRRQIARLRGIAWEPEAAPPRRGVLVRPVGEAEPDDVHGLSAGPVPSVATLI